MTDNIENTEHELKVHINAGIAPIYADDIVHFNVEKGVAKILLAQRFQDNLTHTSTLALPLETVLALKNILNSEQFTKAVQELTETQNF